MPRLNVNGAELYYEESGAGAQAIVFSHGLLWSGRMYDAQVAAFRDRYRCITYDHRGQGQSQITDGGYDMDTLAVDAATLIETLGCAPCHFVGLSMGGFVGLRLAARRPELLRSLVLVESAADAEPWLNRPKYRAMTLGVRLLGPGPFLRPVMSIMFGRAFLRDPARAAERSEMARRLAAIDRAGAARATLGVIERRAVQNELGHIRTPTLILSGADDRAIVPRRARKTAEAIAGARFVSIPRAGHTSTVEEPAAVNAALDEFWRGLSGSESRRP
jgi:pimeloyl-ACP methyl ester carboxylesterase